MKKIVIGILAFLLLLSGCANLKTQQPYTVVWNAANGQTQSFFGDEAEKVWKFLSDLPMLATDTASMEEAAAVITHGGERYYISSHAPVTVIASREGTDSKLCSLELTDAQCRQLYDCVQAMADSVFFATAVGQNNLELCAFPKSKCAELTALLYPKKGVSRAWKICNNRSVREIHVGLDTFYVAENLDGTVFAKYFTAEEYCKLKLTPEQLRIYFSFVKSREGA